jgi:hypothetical protein
MGEMGKKLGKMGNGRNGIGQNGNTPFNELGLEGAFIDFPTERVNHRTSCQLLIKLILMSAFKSLKVRVQPSVVLLFLLIEFPVHPSLSMRWLKL